MIAIVSNNTAELGAFAALCESRGWHSTEHGTVRGIIRQFHRGLPRVLLMRHKLGDGYSDDIITALRACTPAAPTKIIVLVGAGTSAAAEARQLSLGADCVQRDPIRTEVLQAYLAKYCEAPPRPAPPGGQMKAGTIPFVGATLRIADRTLTLRNKVVFLTPREVELAEILHHSKGEVIRYETLYAEVLGRRYRGDTSNMRVLLGKLAASTGSLGIKLRTWVEVIPKSGYRYRGSP